MKKLNLIICGALFLSAFIHADIVFTPNAAGTATGSAFHELDRAFDSQPVIGDLSTSPNDISPVSGGNLGQGVPGDANRQGYIDFGTNFADVEITGLWTAYNAFATVNPAIPYEDLWWSDTTNNVRGLAGTFTDINESLFNFATQAVSGVPSNTTRWTQDFDFSGSPVTPSHRYLILSTGASGLAGGRATEFAITAIPEPSALLYGLVAMAALVAFRRRK